MLNAISDEDVEAARIDMAVVLRLTAQNDLHEGIDNHFSYSCGDGTFLLNRWGVHWSRMKRQDILRVDGEGQVLTGEGTIETTAFMIHEAFHRLCPKATAVYHTHMPYATAIACTNPGRLEPLSQNAVRFYDNIAYEDVYGGLANDREEGERLARGAGDKTIVMMKNHGIMVTGPTIGIAFNDLYFLERAAKVQVLAQMSGAELAPISHEIATRTAKQITEVDEDKETHYQVLKQMLLEDEPDVVN